MSDPCVIFNFILDFTDQLCGIKEGQAIEEYGQFFFHELSSLHLRKISTAPVNTIRDIGRNELDLLRLL